MAKTVSLDQRRQCEIIAQYWSHNLALRKGWDEKKNRIRLEANEKRSKVWDLQGKLDALGRLPLTFPRGPVDAAAAIMAEAAMTIRRGQLEDQLRVARQELAEKEKELQHAEQQWSQFDRLVGESVIKWNANGCEEVTPRPANS
ncbi:MAG: hypothetical protein Q8P46_05385 [Hyphomicrobiales bacterium]|nr:hypothetical protein [Hyphomicrobiales bacterium]